MLSKLLYSLALYIVVLAFHGYTFGENDQIEQLSYSNYLIDNSLYISDLYIQSMAKNVPNERYSVALLLSFFGKKNLEWAVFLLHFGFSLALFLGLFNIAKRYIKQEGWIWIALLVLFLPMYKFNLGGNDLYYNELLSSNMSKAVGVWAVLFFLREKYNFFAGLAIVATLLHPLAGLQVFCLCFGAYVINLVFFEKKWNFEIHKSFVINCLLYILLAGSWLFLLLKNFSAANISAAEFFEFIQFRAAHHFIPSAFGQKNYIVMSVLLAFGLYFFYKKEKKVFGIFLTSIIVAILYSIWTEGFKSPLFFPTQWFKTTIWLKAFAILAIFSWISERTFFQFIIFFNFINIGKTLLLSLSLYCFFQLKNPSGRFANKTYSLPNKNYQSRNDISITLKIKYLIPKNAVFVQAASLTSLKFFSEKSSFVDVKANVQTKDGFKNWYERVQKVYQLNLANRDFSKSLFVQADEKFYQLRENDFLSLKKEGVTHILTKKTHQLNFSKIVENEEYVVYAIF